MTGFDGLLLPGGHAPGMRQYLASPELRAAVAEFRTLRSPVGAIRHGVLLLARTQDPAIWRGLLSRRRTTCLPKCRERTAYLTTAHLTDAWRLGRCHRTCPAHMENEVRAALGDADGQAVRTRPQGPHPARHRG